ncbi:small ribosomal subunit biogenesis GTPase RsgA [Kovacikia minuta CCNUW1]|uniref:small ribosomal subunit biogenesis GTPase RsgA n=1 Tax=Kovacikia minuta TaxID=2931930 RepID=UPI001CCF6C1A|nr:small ribosomal subunit biogenesis GTPase RsgA [Kovacikia minuta]UBF25294.1 small ribosomal subunit biogenesis GTPase RsgA [Kovacikia minuta CCNUW1]
MSADLQDPSKAHNSTGNLTGTVLAIQANYYHVQLDLGQESEARSQEPEEGERGRGGEGEDLIQNSKFKIQNSSPTLQTPRSVPPTLLCTRRSRLKKLGQKVMVGDRVEVEEADWTGRRGAISQVFPRKSELDRPPVANANQILLVSALAEPTLDPYQLSRFLVKAESTGLEVCLCLNKSDLVTPKAQDEWRQRLQQWGYDPVLVSVQATTGLVELLTQLNYRITVVFGPSGVGKSSLINWAIPQVNLRVGAVSGKLGRGRHTTRHVELFELPCGGLLADTPGFNQPELDVTPEELASYFPEIQQRLSVATCQFKDCLHRDEPNCVVRGDWERYGHYLSFLEAAIAHEQALERLGDEESNLKLKTKRQGRQQYEPKLESKKYRRPSRRVHQQALQNLGQDFEE